LLKSKKNCTFAHKFKISMKEHTIEERVEIDKFRNALFNLAMGLASKGRASWTAAEADQQIQDMNDDDILELSKRMRGVPVS